MTLHSLNYLKPCLDRGAQILKVHCPGDLKNSRPMIYLVSKRKKSVMESGPHWRHDPGGCHLVSTCMHTQVHMCLYIQKYAHTHIPHHITLFRIHAELRGELRAEIGLRSDLLDLLIG